VASACASRKANTCALVSPDSGHGSLSNTTSSDERLARGRIGRCATIFGWRLQFLFLSTMAGLLLSPPVLCVAALRPVSGGGAPLLKNDRPHQSTTTNERDETTNVTMRRKTEKCRGTPRIG
jgi:hypothetical protein